MKRENIRKALSILLIAFMTLTMIPLLTIQVEGASDTAAYACSGAKPSQELGPFDEGLELTADTPTGSSYMLHKYHGYTWVDAEKRLGDDGKGIGPGPGEDDDLLCWAATATNVLEWTGWGLVGGMWDTDAMFDAHKGIWNDTGGWMDASWSWWLNGVDPGPPRKVVAGGGNYWSSVTWTDYFHDETDKAKTMTAIDDWLRAGYGVGIFIGGHCITIWGFNYNSTFDKSTNPHDYYLGIWVTDSDSHKGSPPYPSPPYAHGREYPNHLSYYEVEWNSTGNYWYTPNYGPRNIRRVQAMEPYPSGRPVADAGGPYTVNEGTAVNFDGSGSSDAEGDPINYRWDIDDDGAWDTSWSSSTTTSYTWNDNYSGDVVLQVYANHSLDIDTTTVTVNNVAPTADAGPNQMANEADTVNFSGSFTDPGTSDTHTIIWSFGDGTTTTGTRTPTHVYGDNGVYTVTLTVTDDDGGVGTDTLTVTVNNVAPSITPFGPFTVDEGTPVTLTAISTDPGSDDLTFTWEFQLGPTKSTIYYNDGVGSDPYPSPLGTYPFSATDTVQQTYGDNYIYTVTLTVTDDDGGIDVHITTVTVNNVAPSITELAMTSPNPDNPEYILPTVHEPLFTAPATDPGSDDLAFTCDWGDGSPATVTIYYNDGAALDPYPSPLGTYPFSATDDVCHIYSEPGTYTVTLTVEDDDGGVDTATYEIEILGAEEAKHIINDYIQSLPDDALKGNPSQRKKAFNNMFSAIDDMLDDGEYDGVIHHLRHNIREKTDGFVDGSPKNDWITDATAQEHICWKIDALIAYLETLI